MQNRLNKSIKDCKKCKLHKGMYNETTVKCGRINGLISLVLAMPWVKDGKLAVYCDVKN